MPEKTARSATREKTVPERPRHPPSGKQLANRVSNTSEEMAEWAWRYALADVNRRAHGRK